MTPFQFKIPRLNFPEINIRKGRTIVGASIVVVCAIVCGYVLQIAAELPSREEIISTLDQRNTASATEVYDRNGIKIGEFAAEKRYFVSIEKIPAHVRRAFIAIEDKSFFKHSGISFLAIGRALIVNTKGKSLQGASTITQQVARLYFLDQQKTVRRKIKEIILAGLIERNLSKNRILELYLNKVFLGNSSFGVEAASRNYFRKSVTQLTVAEAAMIAGLPKAPSRFAPHKNFAAAKKRARLVLNRMREDGYLSKSNAEKWNRAAVKVAKGPLLQNEETAFFIGEIRKELARKFESGDIPLQGLKIITTLDSRLQSAAADAVKNNQRPASTVASPNSALNDVQTALVTLDSKSGDVLVMQGSSDFKKSQFNRVVSTKRSIGSAHLPRLAAAVMQQGYNLRSFPNLPEIILNDRTYEAGAILESIGIGTYADFSTALGFKIKQKNMSLALGTNQVSPMQLASAYSLFANNGTRAEPRLIQHVISENGTTLYSSPTRKADEKKRMIDVKAVTAINSLLQYKNQTLASADEGAGSGNFASTTAASESATDAWSISYNPKTVTVVWMGSDHGKVKLANDQYQAAQRANAVWRSFWSNIPTEIKKSSQLIAEFPAPSGQVVGSAKSSNEFRRQ